MKLSEAILLGSIGSAQGFGNMSMFAESKTKCALGAALVAAGQVPSYQGNVISKEDHEMNPYSRIRRTWPWVQDKVKHPVKGAYGNVLPALTAIYTLNDSYGWTRPQIAEWVASIEPQEESAEGLNEPCVTSQMSL